MGALDAQTNELRLNMGCIMEVFAAAKDKYPSNKCHLSAAKPERDFVPNMIAYICRGERRSLGLESILSSRIHRCILSNTPKTPKDSASESRELRKPELCRHLGRLQHTAAGHTSAASRARRASMTAVIRSARAGTLQHKPANQSMCKHCVCRNGCYCRDAASKA